MALKVVRQYKTSQSTVDGALRSQLISDYAPLVRFVARRIHERLPSNISVDDLISAGIIGLMDAIEKFDHWRDIKFKTYAEIRIRGAIYDELRAMDILPRSVRDQSKRLAAGIVKLEQQLLRTPTHQEISIFLGLTIEELHQMRIRTNVVSIAVFEHVSEMDAEREWGPWNNIEKNEIKGALAAAIQTLPEKVQIVLHLYYFEDLNLKEIANIIGVTESRISQIHSGAIKLLRKRLPSNQK